jgi:hypothetical protein
MNYMIVNEITGAIVGDISTNVAYIPQPSSPVRAETHYWDLAANAWAARQPMPVAANGTTITGLKLPGEFQAIGPDGIYGNGPILAEEQPFDFDVPGEYRFYFTSEDPRWLPTNFTLVVA